MTSDLCLLSQLEKQEDIEKKGALCLSERSPTVQLIGFVVCPVMKPLPGKYHGVSSGCGNQGTGLPASNRSLAVTSDQSAASCICGQNLVFHVVVSSVSQTQKLRNGSQCAC